MQHKFLKRFRQQLLHVLTCSILLKFFDPFNNKAMSRHLCEGCLYRWGQIFLGRVFFFNLETEIIHCEFIPEKWQKRKQIVVRFN